MTTAYSNDNASSYHLSHPATCSCGCDFHSLVDPSAEAAEAHRRLHDLEAQVKILNTKAASAVDKLADYEDELQYLREANARHEQQQQQQQAQPAGVGGLALEGPGPAVTPPLPGQPQPPPQPQSRLASLSALLPGRRKEVHPSNLPITPHTGVFPSNESAYGSTTLSPPKTPFSRVLAPHLVPSHSDSQVATLSSLQSSLEEERNLRLRAESSLSQTQTELEDLTAQLFGQANEMVATERKARAKLEERVKVLEQRDSEKRKRLDRLEKAVSRIERVKQMVGP
ncbi:hypothetical protein LTR84_009891 [Exophiala bonariae]|uniref:GDP/GTP exchange factor Sec2 N-terminal domain-containing protein n=1 Tax=Exophiala bonariae TaxID=1690606 RepID=A0AAV9NJK2_9EURO|nr:hypothetical protein LTR84_009891 [Exophiala bonariae]